jgi:phenol hydroxylase P2 protein
MANVFIAFQANQESRYIVEAIVEDNPGAVVDEQPAMVKVDVPQKMVIKRETIAEKMGRDDFELQEMHMHLITLSGNVDEDDEQFVLEWKA